MGCPPIQIGGVEDHVHLLFNLSRTETIAKVVEEVKTGSSKWLKSCGIREFAWQTGYAALSVSPDAVGAASAYVRSQEERHAKATFQDELRALLREHGLEFDERYLWD